jgi:predicted secreted hydrolase
MTRQIAVLVALASALLAAQAPGWKSAEPGRPIRLPADHASHPDYKLEWWYYTGNLATSAGRRFGYQLTFFRVGVDPAPVNPSRWAVRDLVMTHLAVSDIQGGRFHMADRMNRPGPGWAGADTDRYRVWNENWSAGLVRPRVHELRASTREFGLALDLSEDRPPVLHGDQGYSRKGAAPGNASYYYSLTRMPTTGTIVIGGDPMAVSGLSWMDHEFGTSFLEPDQVGWDWFSIQLDDGSDLMLFRLRHKDGSIDAHSSGTFVSPDGTTTPIAGPAAFSMTPGRRWTSRASGASYPVAWTIVLPARRLDLHIEAALDDQELRTAASTGVTYWEGAIDVAGTRAGAPVAGRGYLEMTGYAGEAMGHLMR